MTVIPPGQEIQFVQPSGIAGLVRAAVIGNVAGVRDAILDVVGNARDVYQLEDGTWPTIQRREWLSYHWHARTNPAVLPTADNGARVGDPVHGLAEGFIPGDASLPVARQATVVEDFADAADGPGWPTARWVDGLVPAGGGPSVSGRTGILASGVAGGYSGDDAAAVRLAAQYADVEIEFDFTLDTHTDSHFRINLRCDNASMDMGNGATLAIWQDRITAGTAAEWVYASKAIMSKTHTGGATYRARIILARQSTGDALLRARTWPSGQAEPAGWDVDTALSGLPTSGYVGFVSTGISAAASNKNRFDNIRLYTIPPTDTPAWWGSWSTV